MPYALRADWTPSPEIADVRTALHIVLRAVNTSWCLVHPDGPLRSKPGRVVGASLLLGEGVQGVLLHQGVLDSRRGRVVRNLLETAETAATMAVYPYSGNDGGFATAMLPATGTAVEWAYTDSFLSSMRSVVLPTFVGTAIRAATGRKTTVADLMTTPTLALVAVTVLRAVERRQARGRTEREVQRADAAQEASLVMGGYACLEHDQFQVLDIVKNQISGLRRVAQDPAPLDDLQRQVKRERRRKNTARKEAGSRHEMLAGVLHAYQQTRIQSRILDDHLYLASGFEAHDLRSESGSMLLDAGQVTRLIAELDALQIGGETAVEVASVNPRGPGQDITIKVVAERGADAEPVATTIHLEASVAPWRLNVVSAGLGLQALWMLSVCSPGHAHVPLKTVLPWTTLNLILAGLVEQRARGDRPFAPANSAFLCLAGCAGVAVFGPKTMRRAVYTAGGTPFHPGLHCITGGSYLLGIVFRDMSQAARAMTLIGSALTAAAAWLSSRRRPGDGAGFAAELLWPASAAVGAGLLSKGVHRMTMRIDAELGAATANTARQAFVRGWSDQVELLDSIARITDAYANQILAMHDGPSASTSKSKRVRAQVEATMENSRRVRERIAQMPNEPPTSLHMAGASEAQA